MYVCMYLCMYVYIYIYIIGCNTILAGEDTVPVPLGERSLFMRKIQVLLGSNTLLFIEVKDAPDLRASHRLTLR